MKRMFQPIKQLMAVALFAMAALGLSQQAMAAVSGGATIHNAVTVSYSAGGANFSNTANVNVAVSVLAAAPTITVVSVGGVAQTTTAATQVTYNYKLRSNANGFDTYMSAVGSSTDTNVGAQTADGFAGNLSLWGGIALGQVGATNVINLPAGSVSVGVVPGITVALTVNVGGTPATHEYTVTAVSLGIVASTDNATGNTTAETNATITLTPIGAAPAIDATNTVAAGVQIGAFGTVTNKLTAGTPDTAGTDGVHTTVVTFTTVATDAAGNTIIGTAPTVTTTVSSPALLITKQSRNVTQAGAFAPSGTTAKPGEVLEYQVVVTNNHATASATNVSIADVIPAYTALLTTAYNVGAAAVSITATVGGVAQAVVFGTAAADADAANLTGSLLTVNIGATAGSADAVGNGGTILGSANAENVVILYQVTVQ